MLNRLSGCHPTRSLLRSLGPSVSPAAEEVPVPAELSADAARELAAGLLGLPVAAAAQVSSSAGTQVFRITAGTRSAFLKPGGAGAVQREVAVLTLAGDLGVPVPEILAADPDGAVTGVPCVLILQARGKPCTSDSPEFAAIGAKVRLLHEVRLAGFGSVVAATAGLRGENASWADAVAHRITGVRPAADAGLVPATLVDRAETAVRDRPQVLTAAHGGRLLHADLHPRHVYARSGQVTAIIDWADATCGDPVFDLARVLHSATMGRELEHGFAVLRSFLDSYGDAPWLGARLTESVLVHAVVFILWAMRCEFEGGAPWPPWWPAQCAALTAILGELEQT